MVPEIDEPYPIGGGEGYSIGGGGVLRESRGGGGLTGGAATIVLAVFATGGGARFGGGGLLRSRFKKVVRSLWKKSLTMPVGPLRCFAI